MVEQGLVKLPSHFGLQNLCEKLFPSSLIGKFAWLHVVQGVCDNRCTLIIVFLCYYMTLKGTQILKEEQWILVIVSTSGLESGLLS